MPLYKNIPVASSRMGILWTLATIEDAVILEYGCMGHSVYFGKWLDQLCMPRHAALYVTHMSEQEIALGDLRRLKAAVERIDAERAPSALFLLPSTVPEMVGVDMDAFLQEMEGTTGAALVAFKTGGFHASFSDGVEEALVKSVMALAKPAARVPGTYAILGSCADYARYAADAKEVERMMRGAFGRECLCTLSAEATYGRMERLASSEMNIVLRHEALKAAEYLQSEYGTPYVYQPPYGRQGSIDFLRHIGDMAGQNPHDAFIEKECGLLDCAVKPLQGFWRYACQGVSITLAGPRDIVNGLESALRQDMLLPNVTPLPTDKGAASACTLDAVYESLAPGVVFANETLVRKAGLPSDFAITREYQSYDMARFDSPLMGFRGAARLCAMLFAYANAKR